MDVSSVEMRRKKKENSVLHTKKTGIHRIEINNAKFDADFDIKFIRGFFPQALGLISFGSWHTG